MKDTKHLALTKEEINKRNPVQLYLDMVTQLKISEGTPEAKIVNTGDTVIPAVIEFNGSLNQDFEQKLHDTIYGEKVSFDEFLQSRGWRVPKL